jgi:hypothetical protein
MKALRYQMRIGSDHKLIIDIPVETPPGDAEVIVLVPERTERRMPVSDVIDLWAERPGNRSKEDLDREIEQERAGWD